jgi:hypothetical protein
MNTISTDQAVIFHQPSFTNFSATSWCQKVMSTTRPVHQDIKFSSSLSNPKVESNDATEVSNLQIRGCFEVNHTLISFLIRRDVDAGLAFKGVEMNRITATQVVNIASRQKLRRRKQLLQERIGKVNLDYC